MANTTIIMKGPRPPDTGGGAFDASSIVMHADLGTKLSSSMPADYANHQLLRTFALHINLATDFSFRVSASTTIFYCHPTLNSHAAYRPDWLDGTWTDTGDSFVIAMPDPLTVSGMQNVTVKIYSKAVSGTFTYQGFRGHWKEVFGHYVGCFLFDPGVTVDQIYPECYELIPSISASYTAPIRDKFMWQQASTADHVGWNHASQGISDFSELSTAVESSSGGNVIFDDGNYFNLGPVTIDGANGTASNPIRIRPQTPGGAVWQGDVRITFQNCSYIILEGFWYLGAAGTPPGFSGLIKNAASTKWMSIRNNYFQDIAGAGVGAEVIQELGEYNTVHNCDFDNHLAQVQTYFAVPGTEGFKCHWLRFHHNDLYNRNTGGDANGPTDGQLGNVRKENTDHNSLYDHNRHYDYNREPEQVSIKGAGWCVANNYFDECNGGLNNRSSSDSLICFNIHINNAAAAGTRATTGTIQGTKPPGDDYSQSRSNCAHALNWIDLFKGSNGYWQIIRTSDGRAVEDIRWPANKTLVVADIVYSTQSGKEPYVQSAVLYGGTEWNSKNIHFEGVTCNAASAVFDLRNPTSIQSDYTFDSCVMFGGSVGTTNPSGNTFANPAYSDVRGDGLDIPTHASYGLPINKCLPGRLEGEPAQASVSANGVGVTWL